VRIAVISDTHMPRGARTLPLECVARLRAADVILHGGDVTGASFLAELEALGPPVHAVAGNVDEPALQAVLPQERVVEVAGLRIGMVHAPGPSAGRAGRLLAAFPDCAAIVYGHTHLPQLASVGGVWLLNPGSPTERRRAAERTMIELEVQAGRLRPQVVGLGT
jgi:putative phosphoesterase